jgi:hypothetical protein
MEKDEEKDIEIWLVLFSRFSAIIEKIRGKMEKLEEKTKE